MKSFSIAEMERFSGVKAHTLRTWEQRYGLIKPERKSGNTRHYSLQDVNSLLQISTLNRNGFQISHLFNLSSEEITERLNKLVDDDSQKTIAVNKLLLHMFSMNTQAFEQLLDECFLTWPAESVVNDIILVFLQKTDLFWQGHRSTEEHLVVTIIRKKLMAAIEKLKVEATTNKLVVLFLPDTKQLDLALLHTYFRLKFQGVQVLYMGNDVSLLNLCNILEKIKPDYFYTYLSAKTHFSFYEFAEMISEIFPSSKFVYTSLNNIHDCYGDHVKQMEYPDALNLLCGHIV
jgi:MerR family transcriptional regulator, light-induced transcriptional regulator